ncbi:MAG: sugar phosphate nucleotidyltransferase [Bacteroides sp.]|nr:sugar phosphate nucleotidyltransferase [Bacteroides sp.]
MKAMIFAAGLGTRLGEITKNKPKALVEVGGEPMLKRIILKLKDAGITDMTINVHHHAQDIIDYLASNSDFGVSISISDERDKLLDTGGGLLRARRFLEGNEPILLHNADILTDFDIAGMKEAHESAHAQATLLVAERDTSRYLLFDRDFRMKGWENVKTGEIRSPWTDFNIADTIPLSFGGVHIVSPEIFPLLAAYGNNQKFSITPFYTDRCDTLYIYGYKPTEQFNWIDIGKPDSLIAAENIASRLRPIQQQE